MAQQAGGALGRVGSILAKPIPLGQLFSIPIELHGEGALWTSMRRWVCIALAVRIRRLRYKHDTRPLPTQG